MWFIVWREGCQPPQLLTHRQEDCTLHCCRNTECTLCIECTLDIGHHTLPRSQTTNPVNKKIRSHGIPYLQRYLRSCKITVDCIKGCISASKVGTYRLYISVFWVLRKIRLNTARKLHTVHDDCNVSHQVHGIAWYWMYGMVLQSTR